jgi:hypothetical protein
VKIGRGTEVLGGNLSQCHFVHQKSYMTWPGSNPGRRGEKTAINPLSSVMPLRWMLEELVCGDMEWM